MKLSFRTGCLLLLGLVITACAAVATPAPTMTPLPPTATPLPTPTSPPPAFDGERSYQDVEYQAALGPRTPGSQAHTQVIEWMQEALKQARWQVEVQDTTYRGQPVKNVVAKRGSGKPWTIIGAHYDSRMVADQDPDPALRDQPVPGANDGASGVAVLLELARVLPTQTPGQVWLVFFDSEDQGHLPGWDWILGSRAFAESLAEKPDSAIVIDMIGDADLNIYEEMNSDPELTRQVWEVAAARGHTDAFFPSPRYNMIDDHTPFLEKGIRAIDIIDFDYPHWHTTQDTPDKVSPDSLFAVGDTLLYWLLEN